jgi:hypothetical protein
MTTDWGYGAASIRKAGSRQTITYRELSRAATRSGKCVCGKRRVRSTTFTATVNPFNKDPETGVPRTPRQVQDTLTEKAKAWQPDFTCTDHDWVAVVATPADDKVPYSPGHRLKTRFFAHREGTEMAERQGIGGFFVALLDGERMLALTGADERAPDWPDERFVSVAAACGWTWRT